MKTGSWRGRLGVLAAVTVAVWAALRVAAAPHTPSTVILISIDGFWAGYWEYGVTPTLARLAEEGVRAESLVPVFPTKTFPNHYTIVTGLYAEHHGVVANNMWDPERMVSYSLGDRDAVRDAAWYGGEPVWVTAERQGQRAAPLFWPGSEAAIGGVRPSHYLAFDDDFPHAARVDSVLAWLDLPLSRRPTFLTLYFSDVDHAGHDFGVATRELHAALRRVDSALARLVDGLERRDLLDAVSIVVVSDHGMTPISPQRVVFLDDYIDLEQVHVSDWSPLAAIWPDSQYADEAFTRLRAADAAWSVWRKGEVPERFHYREHPRIAPILVLADEGWSIAARAEFRPEPYRGATHGYDNRLPSMQALFVARGPAFPRGRIVQQLENVHLYELMCEILGLNPAPNDGSLGAARAVLR